MLGYARCSTEEQADALEAQITRLEGAGCDQIIKELVSGANNERPGILQAIKLVEAGNVGELLLTRIDRLGRDAAFADALIAMCCDKGVKIRALDGGTIESATPEGFMTSRLMTTMSEFERRMLSQRLKKQFDVYRGQGRHLRGRKPFGYMGGKEHRLVPHPKNWDHALRLLDTLRKHGTWYGAHQDMQEWCPWKPAKVNLTAWFVSPIIRGHMCYGTSGGRSWNQQWEKILYDQHPALISEKDWQELSLVLRQSPDPFKNFHKKGETSPKYGLTGLLTCANCGYNLRYQGPLPYRNQLGYWRCTRKDCKRKGGFEEKLALKFVAAACVDAARDLVRSAADTSAEDPALIEKKRDLDQARSLAMRNPSLEPMVKALEQEIENMKKRPAPEIDTAVYEEWMQDSAFFTEATPEEQRALFGAVLKTVRVGVTGEKAHAVRRSF